MDDDLYLAEPATPRAPHRVGDVVGGWLLEVLLGGGATGDVWRVRHPQTHQQAALKIFQRGAVLSRLRSETLTLRLHDIPGVVQILDANLEADPPWIALSFVDGQPITDGVSGPMAWSALAPLARQLLSVVARLHHAGLTHLDLKPSNILVDASGRLTVVDLGLAQGPGLGQLPAAEDLARGTHGYAAPEQLRGAWPDRRADVFSIGVVLAVLSLGCTAQIVRGLDIRSLQGRLATDAGVPRSVAAVIAAMCNPKPGGRPSELLAVMDDLGLWWVDRSRPPPALGGPERILCAVSRAERLLSEAPGDKRAERMEWLLRMGALVLGSDQRVRPVLGIGPLSPGTRTSDVELHDIGQLLVGIDQDDLGSNFSLLERVVMVLRWRRWSQAGRSADEAGVAVLMLLGAAQEQESPVALRRAVAAGESLGPHQPGLARLVSAAAEMVRGNAAGCLRILGTEPPPSTVGRRVFWRLQLEVSRRSAVSERLRRIQAALAHARQRGDRQLEVQALGWQGHVRYNQGRYREAARLHLHGRGVGGVVRQVSGLLNAAAALMEAPDLPGVEALVGEAQEVLGESSLAGLRARAEWLLRSARHRQGLLCSPDLELCTAAAQLQNPAWRGLLLLTEAAVAWASTNPDGEEIARQAAAALGEARQGVARCLALALLSRWEPDISAVALEEAAQGLSPDIAWQVYGVLAVNGHLTPPQEEYASRLLSAAVDPERRREVLSPRELRALFVTHQSSGAKRG